MNLGDRIMKLIVLWEYSTSYPIIYLLDINYVTV